MAGDVSLAKQVCREEYFKQGLCVTVTVTPTTYIYPGGQEEGFFVELINCPRFPAAKPEVMARAESLAKKLQERLCQHSYTIADHDETYWVSISEYKDAK